MVAKLSRQNALLLATVVLVIGTVWVRYAGIFHDSVLYTFQALSEIDPARYGTDIFLAYGSQNQFTLFSPFYGALIKIIGVGYANALLYVAGVALWLTGAGFLSRVLRIPVGLTIALVAMLPMPYGVEIVLPNGESGAIFQAKEAFLTPRLYAEGLSLFGLALMLRGRPYWALLPVLCGFVLHPVMGLATLLTGFVHETIKSTCRWRWIAVAGTGALLVVIAGSLGVAPANRLFVTVQGPWLEAVLAASMAGTVNWGYGYCQLFFSAALTATLLFDRQPTVKRLAVATLLTSALGMMINAVGWDILRSELILQCQPLRAIWILVVVSRVALARLLAADDHRPGLRRSAFWIFLSAICVQGWLEAVAGFIGFCIVASGVILDAKGLTARRIETVISKSAVLCSAAFFILSLISAFRYMAQDYGLFDLSPLALYALLPIFLRHVPNVMVAIGMGIVHAAQRRSMVFLTASVTVIGLLISLSGILLILSGQPVKGPERYEYLHTLADALPHSGDIYWEQHPEEVWFGLRRTSYLSIPQLNVVAFSQSGAIEVLRRAEHLKVIGAPTSDLHDRPPRTSYNHPWAPNALSLLCTDQKIAYVIADRQPYRAIASFSIESQSNFSFFVYDCASLISE